MRPNGRVAAGQLFLLLKILTTGQWRRSPFLHAVFMALQKMTVDLSGARQFSVIFFAAVAFFYSVFWPLLFSCSKTI